MKEARFLGSEKWIASNFKPTRMTRRAAKQPSLLKRWPPSALSQALFPAKPSLRRIGEIPELQTKKRGRRAELGERKRRRGEDQDDNHPHGAEIEIDESAGELKKID